MNILIVAPHPDDDVFGCGGSIKKHTNAGHHVSIVYMTSGDAGSRDVPKEALGKIREEEATCAAKILGVTDTVFLRIPDGYVRYSDELLIACVNLLRDKKPSIVYIPNGEDGHSDHAETARLWIEVIRRGAASAHQEQKGEPWSVETILEYEVWSPISSVTYIEDITDVMDQKREAICKHASQLTHVRYDKAIEGLNTYRGVLSEKGTYCECFRALRIKTV